MDEEVEARCAREKACQPATGTEAYGAVGPDDVYLSHRGSFSGLEKKKKTCLAIFLTCLKLMTSLSLPSSPFGMGMSDTCLTTVFCK